MATDTRKQTTPRRFYTEWNGDRTVWEEVDPGRWDNLDDHNREILQVGPGDTVFVRRVRVSETG